MNLVKTVARVVIVVPTFILLTLMVILWLLVCQLLEWEVEDPNENHHAH